jgi:hypothetical protein
LFLNITFVCSEISLSIEDLILSEHGRKTIFKRTPELVRPGLLSFKSAIQVGLIEYLCQVASQKFGMQSEYATSGRSSDEMLPSPPPCRKDWRTPLSALSL